MKRIKSVTAYEHDGMSVSEIPENAKDFIEFWQDIINGIPENNRDSAIIELEAVDIYGCSTISVEVRYQRLETDKEEQERELMLKNKMEKIQQDKLKRFNELKKELGL